MTSSLHFYLNEKASDGMILMEKQARDMYMMYKYINVIS